ncbi:MAG: murein L,D-transpeptidase family protein [Thermoanaerobaculia bacterium]
MKRAARLGMVLLIAALCLAAAPRRRDQLPRADRILVEKSHRRLTLLWKGTPVRSYRVALGRAPDGRKRCQGDDRTPEGLYRIDARNVASHYHRALHVSYPNTQDRANARRLRCAPGGDIMIHGLPNGYGWLGASHRLHDWTLGCIAVTDAEIEEIWNAVPNGTVVEIRP